MVTYLTAAMISNSTRELFPWSFMERTAQAWGEIIQGREESLAVRGRKADVVPQRVNNTNEDAFWGRLCGVAVPQFFG